MSDLLPLDAVPPGSAALVGGKALGLAELLRAGLPVPPGFCVTADAHRRRALDADAVRAACRALGGGPVAVRSSAPAEDGDASSFAGQQDTFLG
ncbi:MAG: PEP/pyruvate-binding domain-containing protein, partial [Gemmataceae bacterium]